MVHTYIHTHLRTYVHMHCLQAAFVETGLAFLATDTTHQWRASFVGIRTQIPHPIVNALTYPPSHPHPHSILTRMDARTHTHTHTHSILTRMDARTHAHTHTHTHTHTPSLPTRLYVCTYIPFVSNDCVHLFQKNRAELAGAVARLCREMLQTGDHLAVSLQQEREESLRHSLVTLTKANPPLTKVARHCTHYIQTHCCTNYSLARHIAAHTIA